MNTNYLICKNQVYVEGVDIGQFESLKISANAHTLGNTAVMELPLYALGLNSTDGRASARIRKNLQTSKGNIIRPCAKIDIYLWYDYWDTSDNRIKSLDQVLVFSGFIEHVVEGFPAKIYLQDNSFILRFGSIEKAWNEEATVQKIVEECIPLAVKGFNEERRLLGFTTPIPELTYSLDKKNVQAKTTPLSLKNFAGSSPYDTIQRLMQLLVLYGGVGNDYKVFIGVGVTESTRPLVALSTTTNVIDRDLVPIDGRFVDYEVKVTGILANGRHYTATGGLGTSKTQKENSEFEKTYTESVRMHCVFNTVKDINKFADDMLKMLKGKRNSGRIKLLLYPKIEIMDWVTYTDTVFEELSGGYYVTGYDFDADDKGYYQTLEITDKVFML